MVLVFYFHFYILGLLKDKFIFFFTFTVVGISFLDKATFHAGGDVSWPYARIWEPASLLNASDHCPQVRPKIIKYGRILCLFFVVDGNIWTCSNGLRHPSAFKGRTETSLFYDIDVSDITPIMTVILMVKSVGMAYSLLINICFILRIKSTF